MEAKFMNTTDITIYGVMDYSNLNLIDYIQVIAKPA